MSDHVVFLLNFDMYTMMLWHIQQFGIFIDIDYKLINSLGDEDNLASKLQNLQNVEHYL